MNKQELIDELTKTQEKSYEVWMNLDLDKSSRDTAINVYTGIMIAKTYVDRLDEPQKVKVPACVAKWISKCQELNWNLSDLLAPEIFDSPFALNTKEWLRQDKQNYDILARAWLDGYEIEKEPRWVVKLPNDYYFISWVSLYSLEADGTAYKFHDDVFVFDDRKKAEAVALLVDGSVEEV